LLNYGYTVGNDPRYAKVFVSLVLPIDDFQKIRLPKHCEVWTVLATSQSERAVNALGKAFKLFEYGRQPRTIAIAASPRGF